MNASLPHIQMTEETHNAAMSGSIGIVMAIGVSAVLGWFLLLGLLFSIQDLDATLNSKTGQPVTQIFLDTVGEKGAIVLMVRFNFLEVIEYSHARSIGNRHRRDVFLWVCPPFRLNNHTELIPFPWMTRTFSITSNSRMMYAFARDGGIPGHKFFGKVSAEWRSPIRAGNYISLIPGYISLLSKEATSKSQFG